MASDIARLRRSNCSRQSDAALALRSNSGPVVLAATPRGAPIDCRTHPSITVNAYAASGPPFYAISTCFPLKVDEPLPTSPRVSSQAHEDLNVSNLLPKRLRLHTEAASGLSQGQEN